MSLQPNAWNILEPSVIRAGTLVSQVALFDVDDTGFVTAPVCGGHRR